VLSLEEIKKLAESQARPFGATIYDVEFAADILRILVDRDGGIDIDSIGELSTLISASLDQSEAMSSEKYILEVSSPGVERRLRTPEHFAAQLGNRITMKLKRPLEGQRRYEGIVDEVSENSVVISVADSKKLTLDLADLDTAKVVVDWDAELKQRK
jgi:ribosome maturation factor RimP